MKQTGKGIQTANLQEFLNSASNAAQQGQQQFYTPPGLAASLCLPLSSMRRILVMDLSFGNGALAAASAAQYAIGLDIDARVANEVHPPDGLASQWSVEAADLTQWYPLAAEAGFQAPFILINPPFSLRWHADRLEPLRKSHLPEVAAAAADLGKHVDSTLASFLMALDLLSPLGEGFMVCNASTARRFLGAPDGSNRGEYPDLGKYVWLWLEIPDAIFENQGTQFDTAVLYFSPSHARANRKPLFVTAPSADPSTVATCLTTPESRYAHRGSRITYEYEARTSHVLESFHTVCNEYSVRHRSARREWNIRLDRHGRIRTWLTPFQRVSKRIERDLITRLSSLDGQTPISLCVTATSRTALREAAECGIWTIEEAVRESIDEAMAEYAREGAPFYPPNETMALGWIDEQSRLTCKQAGVGACRPGESYTIASSVESTKWKGQRINLAGESEDLEYTGRELLVKLSDSTGCEHHFHVRRDDAKIAEATDAEGRIKILHWHIQDLINHFAIPIPADLATLRQEEYDANLFRLAELENRVRTSLEKSAA